MYKMAIRGWIKHLDFMLLDEISLMLSMCLAAWIGDRLGTPFDDPKRMSLLPTAFLMNLALMIAFDTLRFVVTRGYLVELFQTLRHAAVLLAFVIVAFAIRSENVLYFHIVVLWAFALYILLSYFTRIAWKTFLRRHPDVNEQKRPILIVTETRFTHEILERMRKYSFLRYQLVGLVLLDRDAKGEEIEGVPVVANLGDAADFICRKWIDDVFFFRTALDEKTQSLMEECRQMALTVHVYVAIQGVDERKQTINYIAGYEVLTASMNLMNPRDAFLKRTMDVVCGLAGSVAAVLLLIILGPFIYAASPGPLIFAQERIGENGRKFKMYKIRSMYPDAEARKAALYAESSHADGMMFKMDFDPRVIGNRILPDGTRKKGIGAFIRDTSLDEFPQFFNVLKGDMSLVGTRPPTPDEWEKYQYRHRARMSVRPGLTGLWQISPDKDTMSFDEVVRLDTEYISNWGLGTDLRILLATAEKLLRGILGLKEKENEKETSESGTAR